MMLVGRHVVEELGAVNELVTAKATPEEAEAFRRWLVAAAQAAADAAREGGFMGFGAEQVSAGEQQMLDRVRGALGMTRTIEPRGGGPHRATKQGGATRPDQNKTRLAASISLCRRVDHNAGLRPSRRAGLRTHPFAPYGRPATWGNAGPHSA